MPLTLDIADPRRRGACPTLYSPMATGDGLLARIRVKDGRLTPAQLGALALAARQHGNGLVEVTARGNLQVRGLTARTSPAFAEAVRATLPVLDGLVPDLSPLAGEDPGEKADPRPLAAAIGDRARNLGSRLGPKVSVVIDGDGQISLSALKADIRLLALGEERWKIWIGNREPVETKTDGAVDIASSTLAALAELGPSARATDLYPSQSRPRGERSRATDTGNSCYNIASGQTIPIALPFGAMHADSLHALAEAAARAGVTTIRLAPDHALLLDNAPPNLIEGASGLGFITTLNDPRRRVSACIGSAGCASGHVPARDLAGRLARALPPGQHLHVSGCSKGCAHPRPAEVTLVGRVEGIGLVIEGRASDTPMQILGEGGIAAALAACREGR